MQQQKRRAAGPITIGVDIGQRVDPTAIAVAEAETRVGEGRSETFYHIHHLERLPLGTDYPAVAERVATVAAGVIKRGALVRRLYADCTGVGRPVIDMLPSALIRQHLTVPVWAVTFTFGDRRTEHMSEREIIMGKAWLVSRLKVLLQTDRILLPKMDEATVLVKELLDYEIRQRDNGNEQFGAFAVGSHDDLVTGLGLAVQDVGRVPGSPVAGGQRTIFRPGPPPPPRRGW